MDEEMPISEPDSNVARLFLEWRSPRFGKSNPQRMNNPVWEWLIRSRSHGFTSTQRFHGPSAIDAGPTWCFDRYGQSKTQLPDGRTVFIAGEHEDSYDPDFCIYNDVVVRQLDGSLDIFGYPREVFTPTDFHSATLIDNRIILIGSLGYPDDRRLNSTQVYELSLKDFKISRLNATGAEPGWIHKHHAELLGTAIVIGGGHLAMGDKSMFVENIDDWSLDLKTLRWQRLTERKWQQWEFRRSDGKMNDLWRIRSDQTTRRLGLADKMRQEMSKLSPMIADIMRKQPPVPDSDLTDLYRPPVLDSVTEPAEDDFGVFRIKVNNVTVRYVEQIHSVRMVCEGELPPDIVTRLVTDLKSKLSSAEKTDYEAVSVNSQPH